MALIMAAAAPSHQAVDGLAEEVGATDVSHVLIVQVDQYAPEAKSWAVYLS
jgi:hypothetical protein